jgi:hypothetical protein
VEIGRRAQRRARAQRAQEKSMKGAWDVDVDDADHLQRDAACVLELLTEPNAIALLAAGALRVAVDRIAEELEPAALAT